MPAPSKRSTMGTSLDVEKYMSAPSTDPIAFDAKELSPTAAETHSDGIIPSWPGRPSRNPATITPANNMGVIGLANPHVAAAHSSSWERVVVIRIRPSAPVVNSDEPCLPTNGFRFAEGLGLFKDRLHCIPAAADDLKATAQERLTWLDGLLEGKEYLCGDRHSLADIMLFVFLEFLEGVGQPINRDNRNVSALFDRVKARPAVAA